MVFGGAKSRTRIGKRIKDEQDKTRELFSLIRRTNTVTGVGVTFAGGAGASSNQGQSDAAYLPTAGGTMIGPVAFFPRLITIASDAIDISKNTDNFSGRVVITSQSGTADDLSTITGAEHAGQLLILQGIITHTITIKHAVGNIRSATGSDIVLSGNDNILMVFDAIANEWTNLSPVADTTGGSGGANTALSNLIATSINQALISDTDSTYDLGSSTLSWNDAFLDKIRFTNQDTIVVNAWNIARDTSDNLEINVPTGDAINFAVNGVTIFDIDANNMTGNNIILSNVLTLNDNTSDPSSNGQFARNSVDVKVFSGGAVRNFSDIGAAGGANVNLSNLAADAVALNTHLEPSASNLRDLGQGDKDFRDLFIRQVRFNATATATTGGINIASEALTPDTMVLNVGTGENFMFVENGDTTDPMVSIDSSNNRLQIAGGLTLFVIAANGGGSLFSITKSANNQAIFDAGADGYKFNSSAVEFTSGFNITAAGGTGDFNANNLIDTGDVIPNADSTQDLGGSLNAYLNLWTDRVRFPNQAALVVNAWNIGRDLSDNLEINVPTGDAINFAVNGVTIFDIDSNNMTGNSIILSNTFTINDSSGDPIANGQFTRNGTNVKVMTGGVVKSLTDIGTPTKIEQLNSKVEVVDAGLGTITTTVDGGAIIVTNASAVTLQGSTTLSIPELFAMIATSATGVADGTMWHDSGTGDILARSGGNEVNLSDIGAGSPLTTKGDLFTFSTVDARLPVGTDGFFLKADSAQATGLVWASSAATEVPVWTQNHDTDGFNLIIDQDADSAIIMDRDALITDDQLGIALGGLGTILFSFTKTVADGLFSVFESGGEAIQIGKTVAEGFISSTDLLKLQIGGTDKLGISTTSLRLGTSVDIELINNDLWFDEVGDATKFSGTATGITMAVGGTNIFIASTSAITLQGTTTLSVPEFFQMVATTATSTTDGVMWHDSGTGDILCRTGGAEKNLSDIGSGGGASFPLTPTITDLSDTWTGNQGINLALAAAHVTKIILDQNLTWNTPTNPPASGTQIEFEIEYVQDGTGGFSVTQWAEVDETVTISSTANSTTIVTYRTNDGGTTYHAIPALRGSISLSGNFLPLAGGVMSGQIDTDGNEILLTADGLSNIGDGGVNGKIRFTVASNNVLELTSTGINVQSGISLDLNAESIIMDTDADSTISAAVDDNIQISTGGVARATFNNFDLLMAVDINLNGNNIDNGGVMFLKEQAAADADVAGSGQIWTDSATNFLRFTEGNGTDKEFMWLTETQTITAVKTFQANVFFNSNVDLGNTAADSVDVIATMNIVNQGAGGNIKITSNDADERLDIEADEFMIGNIDNAQGIILELFRNDATPADSNTVARIFFAGNNSVGTKVNYAEIETNMRDVTSGTEDGDFTLSVLEGGSKRTAIGFLASGGDIFFGIGTSPTAPADYTVTNPSTDRAFDVSTVAIAELAAVVGTIIGDLITKGIFK